MTQKATISFAGVMITPMGMDPRKPLKFTGFAVITRNGEDYKGRPWSVSHVTAKAKNGEQISNRDLGAIATLEFWLAMNKKAEIREFLEGVQ